MWLADTLVGRVESEQKTQTAHQLAQMSTVAKKRSIDRPIRTASTETERIFTNLEYRGMMGKQRSCDILRPRHLLTALCGY